MVNRSERISKAIGDKGLSYAELEKITGVSKSALQRYATGQTKKIPIDVIEKTAAATGVSARHLMGWDEKEENAPAAEGESVEIPDGLEMIAVKATRKDWRGILARMSLENKIKLFEYAKLLLLSQDQADPEDQ